MSDPIARDPVSRDRLLHRAHAPVTRDSRVLCAEHEVVLLLGKEALLGELPTGLHSLATSPVASRLDPSARCFFVSRRAHDLPVRFTRAFADPPTGLVARVDFAAALVVRVADPHVFCAQLMVGQSADGLDAMEGLLGYRAQSLMTDPVDGAVQQAVHEAGSVVAAVDDADTAALVEGAVARVRRHFEGYGLEVLELKGASLSMHAADRKRLTPKVAPTPHPVAVPQMLDVGVRAYVQWADGNHYPGVVRRFERGQYEVQLDMGGNAIWVQPQFVRPA